GGEIRLLLRVGKLRNRDRGQNADDHDHDQQLNERETLAVHLHIPLWSLRLRLSVVQAWSHSAGVQYKRSEERRVGKDRSDERAEPQGVERLSATLTGSERRAER